MRIRLYRCFWEMFCLELWASFYDTQYDTGRNQLGFLGLAGFLCAFTYMMYALASTGLSTLETVLLPVIDPVMNPVWVFLFAENDREPCRLQELWLFWLQFLFVEYPEFPGKRFIKKNKRNKCLFPAFIKWKRQRTGILKRR